MTGADGRGTPPLRGSLSPAEAQGSTSPGRPPARPPGPGLRAQPDAASRRHRPRACAPAALRPGLRPVRPGSSSDPADTNRTVGGPRGLAPSARAASPRLLPPSRAAEAWASGAEAAAVSWIGTRGRPRRRHEARPASGTRGS